MGGSASVVGRTAHFSCKSQVDALQLLDGREQFVGERSHELCRRLLTSLGLLSHGRLGHRNDQGEQRNDPAYDHTGDWCWLPLARRKRLDSCLGVLEGVRATDWLYASASTEVAWVMSSSSCMRYGGVAGDNFKAIAPAQPTNTVC